VIKLVLQPTLEDLTTEQLEQRLEGIRARRIVAAMEYIEGQHLKWEAETDKIRRKLMGHYEMLAKELERCERAISVCEQRVAAIEMLKQEAGVLEDYE
jgi:hypothetical protein